MKFDEDFLREVGGLGLTGEQRSRFLAGVQDEYERLVGSRVIEKAGSDEYFEFRVINDGGGGAGIWLSWHHPDYRSDPVYLKLKEKGFSGGELKRQIAVSLWFRDNVSDPAGLLVSCRAELCREIAERGAESFFAPEEEKPEEKKQP